MIGRVICAIRGHSWTDQSFDYRPQYTQRFSRCHRCQMWTLTEIDEGVPEWWGRWPRPAVDR